MIMGFRDGKHEKLAQVNGNSREVTVFMPNFGNFETVWQWYVMIVDGSGAAVAGGESARANFSISLSSER